MRKSDGTDLRLGPKGPPALSVLQVLEMEDSPLAAGDWCLIEQASLQMSLGHNGA